MYGGDNKVVFARTTCRSTGGGNYTNGFEMLFKSIDWKKRSWFGQLLIFRDVKDTEGKSRRVARSQRDLQCKDTECAVKVLGSRLLFIFKVPRFGPSAQMQSGAGMGAWWCCVCVVNGIREEGMHAASIYGVSTRSVSPITTQWHARCHVFCACLMRS